MENTYFSIQANPNAAITTELATTATLFYATDIATAISTTERWKHHKIKVIEITCNEENGNIEIIKTRVMFACRGGQTTCE